MYRLQLLALAKALKTKKADQNYLLKMMSTIFAESDIFNPRYEYVKPSRQEIEEIVVPNEDGLFDVAFPLKITRLKG